MVISMTAGRFVATTYYFSAATADSAKSNVSFFSDFEFKFFIYFLIKYDLESFHFAAERSLPTPEGGLGSNPTIRNFVSAIIVLLTV